MKLYLAHPYEHLHEIREWELDFEKRSGIELINPFFDVEDRAVPEIDMPTDDRRKLTSKFYKKIVTVDLREILMSDGVVARLKGHKMCGTYMEMVNATMMKKPVYSMIENDMDRHPWIKYYSTEIFTKLKELEDFLINVKNG